MIVSLIRDGPVESGQETWSSSITNAYQAKDDALFADHLSRYQVRRAASIRYIGDDIRYKARPAAPKQMHQTSTFDDGDRLGGPDFPVVGSGSGRSRDRCSDACCKPQR